MEKKAKVLMSFRVPGDQVGLIEKAISQTGIDTNLSQLIQVHITNIGNQVKSAKTLDEKKEIIYSYLNYKLH